MSQVTSASLHDPSRPAAVRLVDTDGRGGPVTPREVVAQLQAGGFFWPDLEDPDDGELTEFSQSLRLPTDTIDGIIHASERARKRGSAEKFTGC